jgi:microcystin-dependent protein
MSQPFMGEIKIISWNFAPKGWAFCNGQFLPINQNQALFSLLGTSFGGNGQTTFALPDFRGRIPVHIGGEGGGKIGQVSGQEFHTVTMSEMPTHTHQLNGSTQSTPASLTQDPTNGFMAAPNSANYVSPNAGQLTTLNPSTVTNVGNSQPHENRQPFLVLAFIIALQGIFPSQN